MPKPPTKATLDRYGLTLAAWKRLAPKDDVCPICTQVKEKWHIDHHHERGWGQMAPQQRVLFVRGIVCARCNMRYLPRGINARIARNIADYLDRFEARNAT
jgi:hypothetical protein